MAVCSFPVKGGLDFISTPPFGCRVPDVLIWSSLVGGQERMARLADHPQYPEFGNSLANWEGCRLYFYGDSRGRVTLGIGHLFDQGIVHPGMNLNYGQMFAHAASVNYPFAPDASSAAVYDDWRRVKSHVLALFPNVNVGAAVYADVAQLRITRDGAVAGVKVKVRSVENPIYHDHPTLEDFDVRIAMAIVDLRFNPADVGVRAAPFDPIWEALETARNAPPGSPQRTQAAQTAYDHFRQLYAHRQPRDQDHPNGLVERYFRRHHQRVQRLRQGLEATFGVAIAASAADEAWHY
jgi:GH24 family phage-related lysozyme (muramidase)